MNIFLHGLLLIEVGLTCICNNHAADEITIMEKVLVKYNGKGFPPR